jgi:hypothetical protein
MIHRFSSRRQRLDRSFLAQRLKGTKAHDRIASYFCASILETAGEVLERIGLAWR